MAGRQRLFRPVSSGLHTLRIRWQAEGKGGREGGLDGSISSPERAAEMISHCESWAWSARKRATWRCCCCHRCRARECCAVGRRWWRQPAGRSLTCLPRRRWTHRPYKRQVCASQQAAANCPTLSARADDCCKKIATRPPHRNRARLRPAQQTLQHADYGVLLARPSSSSSSPSPDCQSQQLACCAGAVGVDRSSCWAWWFCCITLYGFLMA